MTYSIIGILAILIHIIINRDMLWHNSEHNAVPAHREYRDFILGVLVFCTIDVLWGFLNEYHLMSALYATTVIFFIAMMAGFLLWTRYVVAYLDGAPVLKKILSASGVILFCAELVILGINFFIPIQFWFDGNGTYHAGVARYWTLMLQVVLFLLTSVYSFAAKGRNSSTVKRLRRIVGVFGITMAALIVVQLFYPMLPLYSIGYLLSSTMLHSFVVEDEKEEHRKTLEEMLRREQQQRRELGSAKQKIYTDPLTGVKNKQAYMDDELQIDARIRNGSVKDLGIVVFDVNDLKNVNDTEGHDMGDIYIYTASMLISEFFSPSTVYRIGGDEFAVILEGEDYNDRAALLAAFEKQVDENLRSGKVVVSSGMAEYRPGADRRFRSVFERADKQMYQRKHALKEPQKRQQFTQPVKKTTK